MKILAAHNYYQVRGGEESIFETEVDLLKAHGHEVLLYTIHNDLIRNMGRLEVAWATFWNDAIYDEFRALVREHRPDIVHFHNTFPLISPAAYYAVRREGVPVVQTINNYRILCPKAQFFRKGRVCEACIDKRFKWPGIQYACYRDDRLASVVVTGMLAMHWYKGTWTEAVDAYVLGLTEFARQKFIEAGLPSEKLFLKPNFVHPEPVPGKGKGRYALFIGRLSEEKGIHTLLEAWQRLSIPLKIAGDGPLRELVSEVAVQHKFIEYLGRVSGDEVLNLMGDATFLVFPSVWYEGLPRTIVESFARGTPIIASNLGAMSSLITHAQNGLLFTPGKAQELAQQVQMLWDAPDQQIALRRGARAEYEAKYTAERNYEMLMAIYEQAIAQKAKNS
ncbi:MAG: glycosyltransferase [Gammaproteobacteria bacterium]|nr:MAG: glycosyltransferase [Gammaproteobacteria bacterium]